MTQLTPIVPETSASRQWKFVAVIFVAIVLVLSLAYYWFLRADYGVLVQGARPEEAAAIVDALKKEEVAYELRDGGTTILVPANELDAAKLDVSGGDLPPKGTVGFELFNKSDMGLTDFAQKVNYQRALQGEIARTIMSMDGISYARVHLALPERSLFRTTRSEPRAAVTLTPRPNVVIDADRIAGIQRLVAATVPDLSLDEVTVLNERGQLLTPQFTDVNQAAGSASESPEERDYAERAAAAISAALPNALVNIKVTNVQRLPSNDAPGYQGAQTRDGSKRDHSIRVVIFTRSSLTGSDEDAIRTAVTSALSLDSAAGDQVRFSETPQIASPLAPLAVVVRPTARAAPESDFMAVLMRNWLMAAIAFVALMVGLFEYRQHRLRVSQRQQLAFRIREQLRLEHGERR
jgi:flagellar M-ring protein FliF